MDKEKDVCCAPDRLMRDVIELDKKGNKMFYKDMIVKLGDAAEMLWVVLANVSNGDWSKQDKEWQKVAIKWRDNYFKVIAEAELISHR